MKGDGCDMAFVSTFFVRISDDLCHAQGVGVERCLWDQAIGEWDAKEACDAGGEAEEEEVPMETCWFAERELGSLSDEGGDVVVEVEEDGE